MKMRGFCGFQGSYFTAPVLTPGLTADFIVFFVRD